MDILIALSCDMSGISRLPRLLVRHGIRVTVVAAPDFLLSRSSSVHTQIPAGAGGEATVKALEDHLSSIDTSYQMVILGDDQLNRFVAEERPESDIAGYLPCAGDLSLNWSKATFVSACMQNCLPVPETVIGTTLAEAEQAALNIGFPLIFKEASGCAGMYVYCFDSPDQLHGYLQTRPGESAWLIQEPLAGENVTVDILYNHGHLEAWASSVVERTCNGPFSSSTARRFIPMPEVEPYISEIGRMTKAHGLCGVDFIRQPDGSLRIIEMNCRPTSGHSLSLNAGIDFGEAILSMATGAALRPQHQKATATIPTFPEDVGRCIGERDIKGLMGWIFRPSRWKLLPWADPRIFVKNLSDLAERVVNGIWNHISNPMGYSK